MKKILILVVSVIILGCSSVFAQNDGFFTSNYIEYREDSWASEMVSLPGSHGLLDDYDAVMETPISGGILLLAGMGMAYAVMTRRNKMK